MARDKRAKRGLCKQLANVIKYTFLRSVLCQIIVDIKRLFIVTCALVYAMLSHSCPLIVPERDETAEHK